MKLCILVTLIVFVSSLVVEKRESRCYGDLGCFQTSQTLSALPQDPDHVKTTFLLYTRRSRTRATTLPYTTDRSHWQSTLTSGHFDKNKDTKIIIHGFIDNGNVAWMHTMKNEFLKKGDYNIINIDWGHGSAFPFTQATANTFLVSAQVAKLLVHLRDVERVNLAHVHMVGHSLGAHILGNAGMAVRGVGRITGLDPAEPYFKNFPRSQRLDAADAIFVDVIHTDGSDFVGISGYGLMAASGHIDFYPNGGQDQPGCTDNHIGGAILGILHGSTGQAAKALSCSHSRSHEYFIESINSHCKFQGHACSSWTHYEEGGCHGCPSSGCPVMGFDADKTSARGSFYLSTVQQSPFCGHEFFVEVDLSPSEEHAYGKLFVTLTGSSGHSTELEFTRQNRHYHQNDHEKHMIAVHQNVGDVSSVTVTFKKGSGLSAIGTSNQVVVSRVFVQDANTSHKIKFCGHDAQVHNGMSSTFTSHTGC